MYKWKVTRFNLGVDDPDFRGKSTFKQSELANATSIGRQYNLVLIDIKMSESTQFYIDVVRFQLINPDTADFKYASAPTSSKLFYNLFSVSTLKVTKNFMAI